MFWFSSAEEGGVWQYFWGDLWYRILLLLKISFEIDSLSQVRNFRLFCHDFSIYVPVMSVSISFSGTYPCVCPQCKLALSSYSICLVPDYQESCQNREVSIYHGIVWKISVVVSEMIRNNVLKTKEVNIFLKHCFHFYRSPKLEAKKKN